MAPTRARVGRGVERLLATKQTRLTFRETKLNNIVAIGELVGLNSAASLTFEDKEGARKLLQSLRVKPSLKASGT